MASNFPEATSDRNSACGEVGTAAPVIDRNRGARSLHGMIRRFDDCLWMFELHTGDPRPFRRL